MIEGTVLEEVKEAIRAAQADLKDRCISNDLDKPIEFYRGGYAALEALLAALEYKATEETRKAEAERTRSSVLDNIDKLRTWMPGMPALPRE